MRIKYFSYMRFCAVALVAALLCGCSDEDTQLDQYSRMITYLESTHSPALVPESEADAEARQPFYTAFGNSVFRYIDGYYADPDRPSYAEVTATSLVDITYRAYVFNFANVPVKQLPVQTNDPLLEQAMYAAGLTPGEWSFAPLRIDMRSHILKGLRTALMGCREGDQVEIYMTYDAAYGDGNFGIVPSKSPVYFRVVINSVN